MELSVRKTDLLRELQLFQGIVERKNTIPILANVLIEAKEESDVQLVATDLEVTLRSTCPASVVKAGSVTIPAKGSTGDRDQDSGEGKRCCKSRCREI